MLSTVNNSAILASKEEKKKIICRANIKKKSLFAKYFNELHSLFFWTILNAVTVSNRNIITQSIPKTIILNFESKYP